MRVAYCQIVASGEAQVVFASYQAHPGVPDRNMISAAVVRGVVHQHHFSVQGR